MILIVKFISTVTSIGSSESTANRLDKLSKAAGKFNIMIGTSIKKKLNGIKGATDGSSEEDNSEDTKVSPKKVPMSNTKVLTREIECSPEEASLIATRLFNLMEQKGNSDKYAAAKANFDTCKRTVLAMFNTDDYDKLTSEERQLYAKEMIARNAPFKYTTQSIHIKYGDNQTIYSKTRRVYGTAHWSEDFYDSKVDLASLKKNFEVTFRNPVNVSDPNQSSNPEGSSESAEK